MQSIVLVCDGLSKDYGDQNGLFDCNLKIEKGEVFGLIGPNGAGKSTLIKLLMDLVKPTSGTAQIFGKDSQRDSLELKRIIGYLPGEMMYFPGVTAKYILKLMMNLRGHNDHREILRLSERLQLDLNRKFQDLSHGNKQKLGLIQAFMHKPQLLILDEPTLGLDPLIQRELQAIIKEYVAVGNTVILSSHVLSEVEAICDRIGLIDNGQIVKVGTLSELRSSRVHMVRAVFEGPLPSLDELNSRKVESISIDGSTISFQVRGSFDAVAKLLASYRVLELDSRELSLQEVFFSEVSSAL